MEVDHLKFKKEKSRIRNGNFTNIEITWNCAFYKTHLMIWAHIFKVFSVLQVKTVQYFDYVPYWREDASLKKKKIKRDRKRFWASVVTFKHEKRLKSFIEFIGSKMRKKGKDFVKNGGKIQGSSGGFDEKTRKEMKSKYNKNRERVRQEFGLKKKVEMYVEQAEKDVAESHRLKNDKINKKSKNIFDMKDIERREKRKKKKKVSSDSSSSTSSNSSNSSSQSSTSSISKNSKSSQEHRNKNSKEKERSKKSSKTIKIDQVKLLEQNSKKDQTNNDKQVKKPEKKREKKESRKSFKKSFDGVFG